MGCSSSLSRQQGTYCTMPLTDAQKSLIRKTWEIVEPQKREIGARLMLRFLEIDPSIQTLFPQFKNIPREMLKEGPLVRHAKRTLKAIENAVISMDDAQTFACYLGELGRRHAKRTMKVSYFQAMNDAFGWVLADVLKDHWTDETAGSWGKLFSLISEYMIRGLNS